MSSTWDTICIECLVAFPMGKWVEVDAAGESIDPHWGGFRNASDGRWVEGVEQLAALGMFIFVHGGHRLALVETDLILGLLDEVDSDVELIRWIEDVKNTNVQLISDSIDRSYSLLFAAIRSRDPQIDGSDEHA